MKFSQEAIVFTLFVVLCGLAVVLATALMIQGADMTTVGSKAKVKWDKPKDGLDRARTEQDVYRILELVVEVRKAWDDAVDGGVYPSRGGLGESRHTGFDDHDPTHSAATRPTQKQLRGSAKHAATLIAEARQRLEDAAWTLAKGLLRTDPEEWIQHQEKHGAATQRR